MTDDAHWQAVKTAFGAAADLAASERGAMLDRLALDPAVRRDVDELLRAHDASGDFLDEVPAPVAAPDDLVGRLVGAYRVTGLIGAGGMGAVYSAERADGAFDMPVAIKIVKVGMDTAEILRRFHEERRTLAQLHHPNIATLFDGGTTDDGRPFLAMEFVRGTRIDRYCDERQLTIAGRLRLFETVCRAVQHAHQNLIVHRDLKPDNILVTGEGVPKLIDFGIAKVLAPADATPDVTRLVDRRMTLAYASPEQVRGEPIGTASDIYSLGVILYELVSGHRPYRVSLQTPFAYERAIASPPDLPSARASEADTRNVFDETMPAHKPADVARARQTSIASLTKALRGDLDTIVLKAMQVDPDRRYASADQFADDLVSERQGLPVIARPDSAGYRAAKFFRRHRTAIAALVLVILALVGGLASTLWQARIAAAQRDRARAEASRAQQVSDFLGNMLRSVEPDEKGKDVTVAQTLDDAVERVPSDLASQPDEQATILTTIGSAYLQLGRIDTSVTTLEHALTVARTVKDDPLQLIRTLSALAEAYQGAGRDDRAEALDREALDRARTTPPDRDTLIGLRMALASVLQERGALADAEAADRGTLALMRSTGADDDRMAQMLNNLAVVVGTEGRWSEAVDLLKQALDLVRRAHGEEYPDVASALSSLGGALDAAGRRPEAEQAFQEALRIRTKLLGADHPATAWTHYNYAAMLADMGEYSRAAAEVKPVLALRGRVLPDANPLVAAALTVAGRAAMGLGDADTAERELRESLALRMKSNGSNHWLTASSESQLGECLTGRRKFAEAEPLLLRGYASLARTLGANDLRAKTAAGRVVTLYDAWGKPKSADPYRRLAGG